MLVSLLYLQEAFASSVCPTGWIKHTFDIPQCFKKVAYDDISKALMYCQQNNARLPLPKNAAEDYQLTNFMKKYNLYGTMALDGRDEINEGHWIDSYGKTIGYTNWDVGQPDNKVNYVFFTIQQDHLGKRSNGKWDDNERTHKTHIFCIKPPKLIKTTQTTTTTTTPTNALTATTGTQELNFLFNAVFHIHVAVFTNFKLRIYFNELSKWPQRQLNRSPKRSLKQLYHQPQLQVKT